MEAVSAQSSSLRALISTTIGSDPACLAPESAAAGPRHSCHHSTAVVWNLETALSALHLRFASQKQHLHVGYNKIGITGALDHGRFLMPSGGVLSVCPSNVMRNRRWSAMLEVGPGCLFRHGAALSASGLGRAAILNFLHRKPLNL